MRHNRISALFVCLRFWPPPHACAAPATAADNSYDGLWTGHRCHQNRQLRAHDALDADRHRRQGFGRGRRGFRQRRKRGTCASLDQWCICERSAQWQLRIGEVEWGICWCSVQRSMGSVASVSQAGLSELFANVAAADHSQPSRFSWRRYPAPQATPSPGRVRRHGRQLVGRRHRHAGRRLQRADSLPRHLRRARWRQGHQS